MVVRFINECMPQSKHRREARRKTLEAEYEKKAKDIAGCINTLVESRQKRV